MMVYNLLSEILRKLATAIGLSILRAPHSLLAGELHGRLRSHHFTLDCCSGTAAVRKCPHHDIWVAHVQTVGDLRSFISASRPDLAGTSYRLATAFPAAELTDDSATIQGAGLGNAVVVQKPA